MIKLFDQCPACGGVIVVTECRCTNCKLEMRGEFRTGEFSSLSGDEMTFVKVFLRARGNLTEVEKVLGISYPTIRNKLDEINDSLDRAEAAAKTNRNPTSSANTPQTENPSTDQARKEILRQVAAGELAAADALQKLQNSKGAE